MHRLRKRHRRRGNTLHSLWISGGGAAVSLSCALPETIRTIQEKAFSGVNATIFYPRQCFGSPWVGKNYGGTLDWIPM